MPFRVGGDYFRPANGRYVGQFLGVEDGQPQTRTENGVTKTTNTIRWKFRLYNIDGTPVLDPKHPEGPATVDGLSSDSVGIGKGVPAKGRGWLTALLASKGLQFVEPSNGEDVARMVGSAVDAWAFLTFGNNTKNVGGTLKEIEPYTQAAAAQPAPAPVYAAPVAVAAPPVAAPALPVMPAAAPAAPAMPVMPPAAQPLPVPVAAPFVPQGAALAAAPQIPAMPFPAAPTA